MSADFVWNTSDGTFYNRRMRHQGAFHFEWADAVTTAFNNVVGTSYKPKIAVLVFPGDVTGIVDVIVPSLVGAVGIMVLFALLILRGFWIARQAQTRFSTALAAGLISLIAVQTILNLCVVTNLLPSTGIALPFFSYGGTALAVNLGEMGIVLNISRKRTIQEANT